MDKKDKPHSLRFGDNRLLAEISNSQPDRICQCGGRLRCVHITGHFANGSKQHETHYYQCNSCEFSLELQNMKNIKTNKRYAMICIGLIIMLAPFASPANLVAFYIFSAFSILLAALFYYSSKRQEKLYNRFPMAIE